MDQPIGDIVVTLVEGRGLKVPMIGSIAPYCIVDIAGIKKHSSQAPGRKQPSWHESMNFSVFDGSVHMQIFVHDALRKKVVGTSRQISLESVFTAGSQDMWVELLGESGKTKGEVLVKCSFVPTSSSHNRYGAPAAPSLPYPGAAVNPSAVPYPPYPPAAPSSSSSALPYPSVSSSSSLPYPPAAPLSSSSTTSSVYYPAPPAAVPPYPVFPANQQQGPPPPHHAPYPVNNQQQGVPYPPYASNQGPLHPPYPAAEPHRPAYPSYANSTAMPTAVAFEPSVELKSTSYHGPTHVHAIGDKYTKLGDVQMALRRAGLESSNLIVGVDYTSSNTWTGKKTFNGKSLHTISPDHPNPYQTVISVIGRTLEAFDDDNYIPTFGFGDAFCTDKKCFPFFPDGYVAQGFGQVLGRYNEITPGIQLAGPTNFAPIIREAVAEVKKKKSYHILVIIADGQVTPDNDYQQSSTETREAIVEASNYALSIVMVGVGDGPWNEMEEYDDGLPQRKFDNFQFVNFHEVWVSNPQNAETAFATAALQEIPEQYKTILSLGLL